MILPRVRGATYFNRVRIPGVILFCAAALPIAHAQTTKPADPAPFALQEIDADTLDGDEAYATARQQLADARTPQARLRALSILANLQRRRGDFAEGLATAGEGLAAARQLQDTALQVDFLYLLGRIQWNLSDYPQALERHLEELRLAETLGDQTRLARTHSALGLTYHRFGRNEDALRHFQTGLALARESGDERIRASILYSLGNYHLSEGQLEMAATVHEEALRIREGFGNRRAIAASLTRLGSIADARGQSEVALNYLQQALQQFEALKYRRYIATTRRRLAEVSRRNGRTDDALVHLQEALALAGPLQSAELDAEIHREFALTHEARKEFAAALESERRYAAAHEEMLNERDRRTVSELGARYRAEQRELEITLLRREQELQQAEIRRRRTLNLTLGIGLVGGIGLFGVIAFVQLQRLRAERRLRTAHEHARAQAESAGRLKTRLLQMAAHDLKVPLTALHAAAGRIRAAHDTGPEAQRLSASILSDTERMRALVRDFLDAAAHEEGNLQLHLGAIDLGAVARDAVDSLQPVAAQKNQRLNFLPTENLPAVSADPDRLRQVFDNLIGNALKFTPAGGEISVRLGAAGGWVYAEVRDSGPGFGPEEFARIFSPGEPLAAKPKGEEDSTGMGLFIARELLTLQGGRLEVQSKPGAGAIFRVLLPVKASAPAA